MNPNCPNCGAALSYFGEALMCSYSCGKCDFRISIVDANGPAILEKILFSFNSSSENKQISEEPESEELTLAYISIETMSARIKTLEAENARLRENLEEIYRERERRQDREDGYHSGIGGGHGY